MIDSAKEDAAIREALQQHWDEAVALNKDILKENPHHIEALNRIGYAFFQMGKFKDAKLYFDKVLKLDTYNRIALNNVKKLTPLVKKHLKSDGKTSHISPLLFLEEPGKTKVIDCLNVAQSAVLSTLTCGQEVVFKVKKHGIDIRDTHGVYIGALPDDLSFKLTKFMEGGNEYSLYVKHVSKACVSLFIRELKRGKKFVNQPSFTSSINYNPSTREAPDKDSKPNIKETGDEEEKED